MARLLRFLRLEPRTDAAAKGSQPEPAQLDPGIERMRAERKERFASGMEIAEQAPDAQPFLQCAVCETDNNRFAERCTNCGSLLTTPEQRAYNDALWERRRAEQQGVPAPHTPEAAPGNRARGEELAREVGEDERARLGWMAEPPVGVRILSTLPPSWRAAAVLGCAGEILGTGIAAWNTHQGSWRVAFFASVAVVVGIFVPRRR